jgi:hypothetical protein
MNPVVHPHGDAHREALHAIRERACVVGLDEHVEVVVLDRVVDDAEALASGRRDGGAEEIVDALDA